MNATNSPYCGNCLLREEPGQAWLAAQSLDYQHCAFSLRATVKKNSHRAWIKQSGSSNSFIHKLFLVSKETIGFKLWNGCEAHVLLFHFLLDFYWFSSQWLRFVNARITYIFYVINRPGIARAVLKYPPSLIN